MKNKIAIITSENFPYGGPGGNYIRNLAYGLKYNSEYEIEVWLQSGNSRPYEGFEKKRKNSINGINYFFLCFTAVQNQNVLFNVLNYLSGLFLSSIRVIKEAKQLKLIIIYDCYSFGTIFPLIICKILKIKIIKIIPEWFEKSSFVSSKFKFIKWWDFIVGIKKLNFSFDGLIVLSFYLRNFYSSSQYPLNKIFVLPNLISTEDFNIKNSHDLNPYKENCKIVIGYSGSLSGKDGISFLIEAFSFLTRKFQNLHLLVIGDISRKKTIIPFLKDSARNYLIHDDQITFTGLVDFKEVPKLLNMCDILVLPRPSGISSEAGFPTKLGEYFACKKPVVVTSVGDIPKYLTNGVNVILVDPDNPIAISRGIEFLIENPVQTSKIALKGYEWVMQNMQYNTATSRLLNFLEEIVHS